MEKIGTSSMQTSSPDGSAKEKLSSTVSPDGAAKEKVPADGAADHLEEFWTGAFRQRDYATPLRAAGIVPAVLLDQLMPRIFQAGKSVEILARLDRLTDAGVCSYGVDAENNQQQRIVQLYDEFLTNIRQRLQQRLAGSASSTAAAQAHAKNAAQPKRLEPRFQEIVQAAADDEYLAMAFTSMFVSGGLAAKENFTKDSLEEEMDLLQWGCGGSNYLLGDCLLDPLR